jgi:hypothetical protein
MGKYVSISGSLLCSESQLPLIRTVIENFSGENIFLLPRDQIELYNQGWVFSKAQINWTKYVFYGADVRESAVDFVKAQIQAIMDNLVQSSTEGGTEELLEGLFCLKNEDNLQFVLWIIANNKIIEKKIVVL